MRRRLTYLLEVTEVVPAMMSLHMLLWQRLVGALSSCALALPRQWRTGRRRRGPWVNIMMLFAVLLLVHQYIVHGQLCLAVGVDAKCGRCMYQVL